MQAALQITIQFSAHLVTIYNVYLLPPKTDH